ncbi:MAG: high-potential iron-sulfur protein [Cyclobacteriaceae bacterium]
MKKMDRKSFLRKVGMLSITAISGSALLNACGGSTDQNLENRGAPEENEAEPFGETAEPLQEEAQEVDCSEYNQDLTEADLQTREALKYVDESPKPEQQCSNCRFWQPDKFEGACGGCQLFKGAVDPQGWCQSWVVQQT